jgi:phage FluMu protein Com
VRKVSAAMPRHKTRHPPPSLRCPHCGGQSRDLFYHSTYRTRDGPRHLWRCRHCGKGLSERRGTAFFNLKTPEVEVARSLDAMLRGDTQTSTSQTRRHRRETLRRWRRRAAPLARAVDEDFVTDLRVGDLELDERWSFAGRKQAQLRDFRFHDLRHTAASRMAGPARTTSRWRRSSDSLTFGWL